MWRRCRHPLVRVLLARAPAQTQWAVFASLESLENHSTRHTDTQLPLHAAASMSSTANSNSILQNAVAKPAELVCIVDESNNVVRAATRQEMRQQNLMHRATYVVVTNSRGDVFVQKRVKSKETFPGYFDPAPGGVVGAGGDYAANAAIEIEEEMGISNVDLYHITNFYHESKGLRVWGGLFHCTYDGEIVLQEEEVESGEFLAMPELHQLLQEGPVCPDSKHAMQIYFEHMSIRH